jgi:hypothetical protein
MHGMPIARRVRHRGVKMTGFARRYVEWWVDDLPPLHGILRFVFYGGLLLLALDRPLSPLGGISRYEKTSPELFRPYGLLELLGISYVDPEILHVVIAATTVAWICAAIGLFSRVSAVVTALGAAFLHGIFLGPNTLNHNWFLPVYALIALCFARTSDPWSVDYHLRKWWKGSPPRFALRRPRPLADTGFARKVVLVLAVGYYFGAGMTKLLVAGPGWVDGHTIAYFAAQQDGLHPLSRLLAENLWLCSALAVGSLTLELGAPAALFSRHARYALILGWISMHVGIRLSMGPRYAENILCFALLIDWAAVYRAAVRAVRARVSIPSLANNPGLRAPITFGDAEGRWIRGVLAASFLLPLVLAVAVFRVFWWPLTNVYMYCSYFSLPRQIRADHPLADYHDAAAAQRIARGYLESRAPIEAAEYFSHLAALRLAGGESEAFYLRHAPGVATWKQWILTVVRPVLIEDLAAKPHGRIEFDPDRSYLPAQQLLLHYLPVFRKRADPSLLRRYERLELTYPLRQGQSVIASVPLNGSPSSRTLTSHPP